MYGKYVQTFLVVADCGSFSAAAEKLFLTSAAVMKQINNLEEQVGASLFTRTNHGVTLTVAGRSIYKDAIKIIKECDEAMARARDLAVTSQKEIKVGTSLLSPCKILIDLWNEFPDSAQEEFKLRIVPFDSSDKSIQNSLSVLGKEIDVLVGPKTSSNWRRGCGFFYLGKYNFCCAVPRRHRLAKKKILSLDDLKGETLTLAPAGDIPELDLLRDALESEHEDINVVDTSRYYDADVFNACAESGTLLLTFDIWKDVHPSLVTIPVDWEFTISYGLIYSKKASRNVEDFLDCLNGNLIF